MNYTKYNAPSISFFLLLLLYYGCDTCGTCPKDKRFSDEIKNEIKLGDVKNYVNSQFDTLSFICTSVDLTEGPGTLDSRQQECCHAYVFEYLQQKFETDSGIEMVFYRAGDYSRHMEFPDIELVCDNFDLNSEGLAKVTLAGIEFEDVLKVNCDSSGYSIYFREPEKIVGFTIDSMEYAIIK